MSDERGGIDGDASQRLVRALRAHAATAPASGGSAPPPPLARPPRSARWVLLFALLLGLVAGAVTGLLTLV